MSIVGQHFDFSLRPLVGADHQAAAATWNSACGQALAITPRFVDFNMQLATGSVQAGQVAMRAGEPIGFAIASLLPNDPLTSPSQAGWIDALAVLPEHQSRGVGSALLEWAERWLAEQGCTSSRLGGSLRPFIAGYPVELGHSDFFGRRGYGGRAGGFEVWDVARDLSDYRPGVHRNDLAIRPAHPGDEQALFQFLVREFPNRWRFEYQEYLRLGGRMSDWMILLTERGVDGFARLAFQDSLQPFERYYPCQLPQPWGQGGPIGVSQDVRGQGYGRALIEACLCHMRDRGVRGCVIDWTARVEFYALFGFKLYRKYYILIKTLG